METSATNTSSYYSTRLFFYQQKKKLSSSKNRRFFITLICIISIILSFLLLNEKYAWKLIFEQECIDRRTTYQFFDNGKQKGCLSRVWERYTHSLSESDAALINVDIQTSCSKIVRLGNYGEGGWDICGDDFQPNVMLRSSLQNDESLDPRIAHPCRVYSFGINDDPSFDKDLVRRWPSCTIYAFDPSIGRNTGDDFLGPNIKFYNIGLGGFNKHKGGWHVMTLDSIMKMLNHDHVNLVKMDIEGWEWETFLSWEKSGVYKKIGQLVGEIHFFNNMKSEKFIIEEQVSILRLFHDTFGFHVFRRRNNFRFTTPIDLYYSKNEAKPIRTNSCLEIGWRRSKEI